MLAFDTRPQQVERVVVRSTTELDCHVFRDFEDQCIYDLDLQSQKDAREKLVREAFVRQLQACPAYRGFVQRRLGTVDPDTLPLSELPVFPTTAFKGNASLLSVAPAEVERWSKSSGTQGPQSVVPRDRITLERLLGSVQAGTRLIDTWYEGTIELFNLGPAREAAGDIWFTYVMSLVELVHETHHEVQNGKLDAFATADRIEQALGRSPRVGLIGPPVLVLELLERWAAQGRSVDAAERLTIITAGGWKRHGGVALARPELEQRCADGFKLQHRHQVRDAFNQVELNSVFMECSAHHKHVPPWVFACTRNPATLAAQPAGTPGLMSFLDASANSYPAFIVSDDVGTVEEGDCACGRSGTWISIQRRVEGRGQRGCAIAMDRAYAHDTKKH
jgi:long-chain-fatty-acid---luciferin-component ligase